MARNYAPHPLFPAKSEDDEPPEVVTIQIQRREPQGTVTIPRRFMAEDLQDENQIYEWYGGGTYELIARNNHHITARRGFQFPGAAKPLVPASEAPAAAQQVAAMPAAYTPPPQQPGVLSVVTAVMPLVLQWMTGQQQMQQQSAANQQAMIAAMMNQAQQSNAQIITLLTSMNKPTVTAGAEFKEGMNFMQEMLAGQLEAAQQKQAAGEEGDDIMKTIQAAMQGLEFLNMFKGATDGTPPTSTPAAGGGV